MSPIAASCLRNAERHMENDELLDLTGACALIGGCRPINPATLYRGVKSGIYPQPVKVAPNVSRWRRSELDAALNIRIALRDQRN
jgi:predicted DNA-binding transcriptional regulator AlpA